MKRIVHQPKIHYYILLLIMLCPCVHATTSKKAAPSTKRQKSQAEQPVHQAAINGNMGFFTNLSEENDITNILNTKDKSHHNFTPLHHATANNQEAIVRFILEQPGIQVNAKTKDQGSTALHILIQCKHFNLLDCFIAYKKKQTANSKQFTRLFLKVEDISGKIPCDYFPKDENEQLTQYKLKWDKLVGKTPKKQCLKPKHQNTQGPTKQPPLPLNISTAPLSPATSDDGITSSPSSVDNKNTDHNTVPDQTMGTSKKETIQQSPTQSSHSQATEQITKETATNMVHPPPSTNDAVVTRSLSSVTNHDKPVPDHAIATIKQSRKQSSHSQTAQPITTNTKRKASLSKQSQQHSSAHHPPQQGTAPNSTSLQEVKATTTKEVDLFYYLQCMVGVLLLGSIFYLIATQLKLKAF